MEMQCLEAYPKAQDYLTIGISNLDLIQKILIDFIFYLCFKIISNNSPHIFCQIMQLWWHKEKAEEVMGRLLEAENRTQDSFTKWTWFKSANDWSISQ